MDHRMANSYQAGRLKPPLEAWRASAPGILLIASVWDARVSVDPKGGKVWRSWTLAVACCGPLLRFPRPHTPTAAYTANISRPHSGSAKCHGGL